MAADLTAPFRHQSPEVSRPSFSANVAIWIDKRVPKRRLYPDAPTRVRVMDWGLLVEQRD